MAAKSCVQWLGSALPPLVRNGLNPPPSSLVGDGVQRQGSLGAPYGSYGAEPIQH